MNVVGLAILLPVLAMVLFAPKRWALIGVMGGVLYLTQGQQLNIGGVNVYATRFVELAAFVRVVIMRREFSLSQLNELDWLLLAVYAYTTIIVMIRATGGTAYEIGETVDAFLAFCAFRGLVADISDFRWFLRSFLILLVPYAALVFLESRTHHNVFSTMGGVELGDWMRDGKLRCQTSFRHPSLLGTLGASFLPLYIAVGHAKSARKIAIAGAIACLVIVWGSNSGGPANCTAVGILGWMMWRIRTKMKWVRRAIVLGLITVGLSMKAPIWYLPERASNITGGDGWHRSYLMDVSFRNLDKWWLKGMSIDETRGWFPYNLRSTGSADITNLFIEFGLSGGLVAMSLFIGLLVRSYSRLGRAMIVLRSSGDPERIEPYLWGLGVVLTAHTFNWLGITYFDQTYMIWYLQLAAISTLAYSCLERTTPLAHTERSDDVLVDSAATGVTV